MKAIFIASAAALAFSAAFAASVPEAAAKPVPMCFKTGNGKHYLRVNRADGFLLANATSCSGDAVFMVEYGNLDPRRVPLVGPPVVMKAANGRYVQFYGSRLRATAPKIARGNSRFMYLLRPSHGGIRAGTPLKAGMRLNIFPTMARLRLMTAAINGGGRDSRNLSRRNPRDRMVFFTLTAPTGGRGPVAQAAPLPWKKLPGAALDIGVGGGQAWVIGTDQGIYRWDGKTWGKVPGAAVRIAVGPRGMPWVVNKSQDIYRYTGTTWQKIPGKAFDIAVDAGGGVYIISNRKNGNDFDIFRLQAGKWVRFSGNSTRIAAGPQGIVVAADRSGATHIFRNGKWDHFPGKARDVAIGANGTVWKVAPDNSVHRWDGKQWVHHTGGLMAVAADAQGIPWGVAPNKGIYAHAKSATLSPKPLAKAVDPKMVEMLKRKMAALQSAMKRYQATAGAYMAKAKDLEKQRKSVEALYKKTAAQLKQAMGR